MPLHHTNSGGWKWGEHGKEYRGSDARKKAVKQMRAIFNSGYHKSTNDLKDLSGGAQMSKAKRVPKPTLLKVKKSLDNIRDILNKGMPPPNPEENPNYEEGNGGEIQLKPEEQIDAAEHQFGREGERLKDPSEGKVNKAAGKWYPEDRSAFNTEGYTPEVQAAMRAKARKEREDVMHDTPYVNNEGVRVKNPNLGKEADGGTNLLNADMKNIVGAGVGGLAGGAIGGPTGAGIGAAAGSALTQPKPPATAEQKSLDIRILKCNAELKIKKAIVLTEGYSPMTYIDLLKAFGSTQNIPDIMKEEISRPPASWFENAIMKSSEISREPFKYAVSIWYGKGAGLNALGMEAGSEAIKNPKKIGEVGEGFGKLGTGIEGLSAGVAQAKTNLTPGGKENQALFNREVLGQHGNNVGKEDENVEKWLGGGLMGAGIGSLVGHPIAGAAIGAGAEEVGGRVLGKCVEFIRKNYDIDNLDETKLGEAVIDAMKSVIIEDSSLLKQYDSSGIVETMKEICKSDAFTKAVAEPLSSKKAIEERKPKFDEGGESDSVHDGSRANVKELADKSKTEKTW